MNAFITLLFILLCSELTLTTDRSRPKLTALNDSAHALHLYLRIKNEDAPSNEDPSTTDARIRKRICQEITASNGFFRQRHFMLVDPRLYRYTRAFKQTYGLRDAHTDFSANLYEEKPFKVGSLYRLREHVFGCMLLDLLGKNGIVPFYVSKEYNVSPFHNLYMPGRFLIGNFGRHALISYNDVVLAETPAEAHLEPGFNVELHYLRIRKYVEPARTNVIDPFCKLVSGVGHDPDNQHYRLCVAVFTSSYFKYKVRYPQPGFSACSMRKVSFKTAEGKEETIGKSYSERMTLCYTSSYDFSRGFSSLYISRAYGSNRVFVYRQDPSGANVYLENLSTNVSVVDELNSFDFVEY